MDKFRLRFSKTGRAIYISHLDLMHTLQRSFSRAGFRVKYSEGFNPHPCMSSALPLSVCMSSICEVLDFRLEEETDLGGFAKRLNEALPEGIEVTEVYIPERKCSDIKWLRVEGILEYDSIDPEKTAGDLTEFYSADSIIVSRKTKSGISDADLCPMIKSIVFEPIQAGVIMNAVISAQNPTLNPELLVDALRQKKPEIAPDFSKFTRIELYDSEMNVFR